MIADDAIQASKEHQSRAFWADRYLRGILDGRQPRSPGVDMGTPQSADGYEPVGEWDLPSALVLDKRQVVVRKLEKCAADIEWDGDDATLPRSTPVC